MMSKESPLVQWTFMQYKNLNNKKNAIYPDPRCLHTCTQIGSKLLIYGGCNIEGEPLISVFLYDTISYHWSAPNETCEFQEDHPGPRYGHTTTLIDMHPPRLMVFGGLVGGGTFEFDSPDSAGPDSPNSSPRHNAFTSISRSRRQGKKAKAPEESDDRVYFLDLKAEKWIWSRPLVHGSKSDRPCARTEHTAVKIGTNDIAIFGGWGSAGPLNDFWVFNSVDMEWKEGTISGIRPRPRYRHTCELIGSILYILGGSDNNEDVPDGCKHLGIHALNLETMEWSHPELRGINPFPRSGHSSTVLGAKSIAVFGGRRTSDILFNDTVIIDTTTFSTTVVNAVQSHLPTPISNCSINAIGNRCFVFGGTDTKNSCYNDIRMLDVGDYLDANDVSVGAGAASDYCFKIIIIGDASVGKSSLLSRFSDNVFIQTYTTTIGIDFNSKMIRVDKAICKLEIWDTAGQERFSTITANYYRGAQGALLVYDVGNKESFNHIQTWYDRAKQLGGENMETVIIGNKNDLSDDLREVSSLEGEELAASLNIQFLETSAMSGMNVEKAFVAMTSVIKQSVDRRGLTGVQATSLRKTGGVTLANAEKKKSLVDKCCS